VPPHRVLAINRGERAKVLRVKVDFDLAEMTRVAEELLVPPDHPHADFLRGCARDALQRLVVPSLEREVRRELTENAESHAVDVFAKNLRNLLLQAPVRNRRVMALDPGFKSGCKTAVLDEFGNLLDHAVVHLIGKAERRIEARANVVEMIRQHSVKVLAIGNGTACRETEEFVAEILAEDLKDDGVAYVIVNEAGASVYSTSPLGREELPQYDATLRGAISIGRRLQDPLSELVKIDPASIGVGLYQHDVKAKHLRTSLDAVVESCVNYVGVDLNSGSPALLRYVSGLNQLTARRLYDYRVQNGPIKTREQLKEVPGFGDATFVQAAGFLKITDGENALDATWIHPESYDSARTVLQKLERSEADVNKKEAAAELAEQAKTLDVPALAEEMQVGQLLLRDIVAQLTRPGRDPREDLPEPIFKRGILKLEDLEPNMELSGSVLNVVDFGAFVDIGLHDSGLVHVSQLANRYVRDPHEVVSVGDIVKVWVLEIDKTRRRVSLTMIPPGSKKPEPQRRGRDANRGDANRPAGEARPPRTGAPGDRSRPPRPHTGQTAGGQPGQPSGAPRGGDGQRGSGQRGGPAHLRPYGSKPQGGRPQGGRPQSGRPQSGGSPPPAYKPKPKPQPPITKKMAEGKEPLRTFGDLFQFVKVQSGELEVAPPPDPKKKPKRTSPPAAAPAVATPESSERPASDTVPTGETGSAEAASATDGTAESTPPASE
ncbi:MAG: helix-hairpin-helix domain-containing protein, partial [Planctomycetota bacterium]|nr:helix-hairpin-helix domain-containing protein [Planctomycetota bacterium]